MSSRLKAGAACAVLALMSSSLLHAGAAAESLTDLKRQLDALHERASKLEAEGQTRTRPAARRGSPAAAVEAGDKPTSIRIPGTNTSLQVGGFVRLDAIWDASGQGPGLDTTNAALALGGTGLGTYDPALNAIGASVGCAGLGAFLCQPAASRIDNRFNGGNFRFHARLSRFWLKTWTPTDFGELQTHIATDFLHTTDAQGGILRLRQAFGSLGPVTAGFLESLFRPTFAESETLDFGGTVGYAAVRKAQIRYTHAFSPMTSLALAIEDPGDSIGDADIPFSRELNIAGTSVRLAAQRMPDLVAAFTHRFTNGQIWVAGMVRLIEHDSGGEPASFIGLANSDTRASADTKLGWGVAVAGTYDFTPRFSVGAHGFIGRGIGSYVGSQGDNAGASAAFLSRVVGGTCGVGIGTAVVCGGSISAPLTAFHDALVIGPNEIRTILSYGGFVWARYQFTDTMRTNVAFGYATQQIENALPRAAGGLITFASKGERKQYLVGNVHYIWSVNANVIWSPVPQVDFGIEYIHLFVNRYHGEHQFYLFANDRNALISRVLGMMMYRF
jgi:hypothetical protein